jgi:hypothetical protein
VEPKINPCRAIFVLGKIDEILGWEKTKEKERDVHFVELGEYLCELRAKQYWNSKSLRHLIISWRDDFRHHGVKPIT